MGRGKVQRATLVSCGQELLRNVATTLVSHLSFSLPLVPSIHSDWLRGFLFSFVSLGKVHLSPVWKENLLEIHPSFAASPAPSLSLSLPKQCGKKVADRPGFK